MATNGVHCSYQEVVDLHTESDRVTAIGIHTPTGSFPRQMFKGFFDMYKKFKYLGCSISLVPAARLPADPSQVSYEGGEPPLDARDLMNPIMFHGCHGDDLGGVLNRLYGDNGAVSDSLDGIDISSTGVLMDPEYSTMERLYYKALTDKTWKKAHPMRGFRKSGLRPLLYSLAVNRQIMPASIDTGLPDRQMFGFNDDNDLDIAFGDPTTDYETSGNTVTFQTKNNLQFSTPRLTGLGWLDTRQVLTTAVPFDITSGITPEEVIEDVSKAFAVNYTELPKLFMGVILLPPAYKTEQYFRMIINHYFAFKNFRGVSFQPDITSVPTYWNKNGDGTGAYDVVGDLDEGHFGPLNDGGGSTPIPPGPEPDPPVATVPVVFRLRANSGAAGSNGNFVFLGYKQSGDSDYTYFYENRDHTGASYEVTVGPFDIPVGAVIGGTYSRLSSGNWIMGDLSARKLMESSTITFDSDTYSLTSESNIGSEVPSGSAGLYVGWVSDVSR